MLRLVCDFGKPAGVMREVFLIREWDTQRISVYEVPGRKVKQLIVVHVIPQKV